MLSFVWFVKKERRWVERMDFVPKRTMIWIEHLICSLRKTFCLCYCQSNSPVEQYTNWFQYHSLGNPWSCLVAWDIVVGTAMFLSWWGKRRKTRILKIPTCCRGVAAQHVENRWLVCLKYSWLELARRMQLIDCIWSYGGSLRGNGSLIHSLGSPSHIPIQWIQDPQAHEMLATHILYQNDSI